MGLSSAERQRRYIARLKGRADQCGRTLPEILADLDRLPPPAGADPDQQPGAVTRAILDDAGVGRAILSVLDALGESAAETRAATDIARWFGLALDPVPGLTYAALRERVAAEGISSKEVAALLGGRAAFRAYESASTRQTLIDRRSAHDLRRLLERVGLWRGGEGAR